MKTNSLQGKSAQNTPAVTINPVLFDSDMGHFTAQCLMPLAVAEIFGQSVRISPCFQALEYVSMTAGFKTGRLKVIAAADNNGHPIGFLAYNISPCPDFCHIALVYVQEPFRGRQVGAKMVRYIKRKFKNVRAVAMSSEQPFFKSLGFRVTAKHPQGDDMSIGEKACSINVTAVALSNPLIVALTPAFKHLNSLAQQKSAVVRR